MANYRYRFPTKKFQILIIIGLSLLVIISSYFYLRSEVDTMRKEKEKDLKAVAELKINELIRWRNERTVDAVVQSESPFFAEAVYEWLHHPENTALKNKIRQRLILARTRYQYAAMFISSVTGNPIIKDSSQYVQIESITKNKIIEAVNEDKVTYSDFYKGKNDSIYYDIITPIVYQEKQTIALLVLRINPEVIIYPLLKLWPTQSKTSETLIVRKDSDRVVFLNELRFKKNTSLSLKFSLKRNEIPAVNAVNGYTGFFEGKDYRGTDVLAYISPVKGTDWFLIAKIDKNEFIEELVPKAIIIFLFTLLIILLLVLGLSYIYNNRQKNIYKTLIDVQEEFKTTLYSIGDAVITTDRNGRIKHLNNTAEKLTGWAESEARDKPLEEVFTIISEVERNEILNPVQKVLKDGLYTGLTNHTLVISKDGREIPILDSGAPIKNKDGEITGVVMVFRDETKERTMLKSLRESENRYRTMFENHAAVKLVIDPETGDIVNANQAAANYYGWSREQLQKMKIQQLNTLSDDEVKKELNNIVKLQKGFFEYRHSRADGSIRDVEIYSSKIEIEGKTYLDSIIHDVTASKESERQIRLLSRAIEQAPVSVFITDLTGEIEFVNAKFTETTGYSFSEVAGMNPRILKSGAQPNEFYKQLWETILSGKDWNGELINKKKNGEVYWVASRISPVVDDKGRVSHFVAAEENITQMKKMLEDLVAAKEKAEEINRLKSTFFANMSHELRTPFVGIMGYAEILYQTLTNPEFKSMAEGILDSAKRLTETLSKILSLTKIEFSKEDFSLDQVNITSLIDEVYRLFLKAATRKDIELKKGIYFKPFSMQTNNKMLSEVLNNIVNNAIKFTGKGCVEISAFIEAEKGKELLIIKVSDTGIGIPQEKLDIIWDEFRQVSEGSNRSYEGSGLGLSISKKYIELLGGKISVQSKFGEGTTFTVQIPILQKSVPEVIPDETIYDNLNLLDGINTANTKRKKVLYVEDDLFASDVIKRILIKYFEIDLANNAENAFKYISKKLYDVILMDINLGSGLNGMELSQHIKKIPGFEKVPIIAVTAYAGEQDKKDILEGCIDYYISKPFMTKDLIKLLEQVTN